MGKKALAFTEDDVRVLKGLQIIQGKPSMYIGPIDDYGLYTIKREPCDNVVDEWEAGRCSEMTIRYAKGSYIEIHDDGQGMPIGIHKTEKIPTVEVLVSQLHAGGKLGGGDAYKNSRGTHGIGIKATNALSEHFVVMTFRDKAWHILEYKFGKKSTDLRKMTKAEIKEANLLYKKGTVIRYKPNLKLFDKGAKDRPEMMHEWAQLTAYLAAGFTVNIMDDKGEVATYCEPDGLAAWLVHEGETLKATFLEYEDDLYISGEHFDIAVGFSDAEGSHLYGYCNGLYQPDGGLHLNGLRDAIYWSIEKVVSAKVFASFDKEAIFDGMIGMVNFKIDSPKFSSQTKEKLADTRFNELCYDEIYNATVKYFKKNKALLEVLVERAASLSAMNQEFRANKQAARKINQEAKKSKKFDVKVFRADSRTKPEEIEVFFVEGDSAGGTARTAKLSYQTVVPLKGKIINAMRTDGFFDSQEVVKAMAAIGYDPDAEDPTAKLQCGKIILLSDPDPDGAHINCLDLALMYRVIPKAIEKGMVYALVSPKYSLRHQDTFYTAMSVEEMAAKIPKGANIGAISYIKGWGEIPAGVMQHIAFMPGERQLIRITMPKDKKAREEFELLMSEDSDYRKKLLNLA